MVFKERLLPCTLSSDLQIHEARTDLKQRLAPGALRAASLCGKDCHCSTKSADCTTATNVSTLDFLGNDGPTCQLRNSGSFPHCSARPFQNRHLLSKKLARS